MARASGAALPASAEYRPHHDYFDPAHPGTAHVLQRGDQRVGTLVMYLNTPQSGGDVSRCGPGVGAHPWQCRLLFSYDRPHASARRTLHGSAAVTAGEKWVATK